MSSDYAAAIRNGSMAASRLHVELDTQEALKALGGSVDVFGSIFRLRLPLLIRPLKDLLGAYLPIPTPGLLVTTERPLAVQRFTAAHELGHFRMQHLPSLDDSTILRRGISDASVPDGNFQEVEANAFAVSFLMPLWLIQWHCIRQGWTVADLAKADCAYQLSLRLGVSYEAISWTLQTYNLLSPAQSRALRQIQPRNLKADLLKAYRPDNYRGDVWALSRRDVDTRICGSRNDHFVLTLNEHSGGGYLWNFDQLRDSGFAIVHEATEAADNIAVGGAVVRKVTAAPTTPQRGHVALSQVRPWEPAAPIEQMMFDYDFTGPEEPGFSHAERRGVLAAV